MFIEIFIDRKQGVFEKKKNQTRIDLSTSILISYCEQGKHFFFPNKIRPQIFRQISIQNIWMETLEIFLFAQDAFRLRDDPRGVRRAVVSAIDRRNRPTADAIAI